MDRKARKHVNRTTWEFARHLSTFHARPEREVTAVATLQTTHKLPHIRQAAPRQQASPGHKQHPGILFLLTLCVRSTQADVMREYHCKKQTILQAHGGLRLPQCTPTQHNSAGCAAAGNTPLPAPSQWLRMCWKWNKHYNNIFTVTFREPCDECCSAGCVGTWTTLDSNCGVSQRSRALMLRDGA